MVQAVVIVVVALVGRGSCLTGGGSCGSAALLLAVPLLAAWSVLVVRIVLKKEKYKNYELSLTNYITFRA